MSPSKEDYLKCIYELGKQQAKVSNKLIAHDMDVSAPATTGMIKKLLAERLIEKNVQKGYVVTALGLQKVSQVIRKHRLIEVFLIQQLGYSLTEVHNEAEILEHSVSNHFINQLDKLLGYPKTCPHGGKIPREDEVLKEDHLPLNKVEPGYYYIRRLHYSQELVEFLDAYNITTGSKIEVIEHNDFAKMTTLIFEDKRYDFSDVVCSKIFVETI
ncbi:MULTISPECIES: metal-dependent transcriptional regulator [unclassified Granulicatella]|uniref:metal-dependent transcriptional regulator n=1 Tax=unclassified Granulicatella TaxID=2630493 RepID=UPI0010746C7C|nr:MULTISPECIES: metal-dependent transcriptional regulator [unclassified Granulicatella]MBF0779817.1 metal-dependent transcriptional regulator [Granulicatella sp. 19428wC4_WM01]TFU96117.1 metal-dependent transcriptional regulator [Granulicatella sp. WM01]